MKAIKNQKSKKTINSKEYKILTNDKIKEPYWDEGWAYHKSRGIRKWKKKQIFNYQVRLYRTWKHNRKTKWKETVNMHASS